MNYPFAIQFTGPAGNDGSPGEEVLNTLAEMKARDLDVGVFARTAGYYEVGDGGDSSYEIVDGGSGAPAADDAFYVQLNNGNLAKLLFDDQSRLRLRQLGVKGGDANITTDTARIAIAEDSDVPFFDAGGLIVKTTRDASSGVTKGYYNGHVYGRTPLLKSPIDNHPRSPLPDTAFQHPRTKTPLVDLVGREALWLGTSLVHIGAGADGIAELTARGLGFGVTNMGFAGSAARWDIEDDEFDINSIKRLSMTDDDRLAGQIRYGIGSVYYDNFDPQGINKASQMTADYRIKAPFIANPDISVVFLDHNHNDRNYEPGTLDFESIEITSITKGVTTDFLLTSAGTVAVGDGVGVVVNGIPNLNYFAGRVQAFDSLTKRVTLNVDSSGFSGSFVDGTLTKFDRGTVCGAFGFLIYYIRNCMVRFGSGNADDVHIILAGAPSEYTGGDFDAQIYSTARLIESIAEFFDLSFFDLGFFYDVQLIDHLRFFPDNVHWTTEPLRQAGANEWIAWLSGGAPRGLGPDEYLHTGNEPVFEESGLATYSEFLGGWGTPKWVSGVSSTVMSDDFAAGFASWSTITNAPTWVDAPWGSGKSVHFVAPHTTSPHTSQLSRAVAPGRGRSVEFDFYMATLPVPPDGTVYSATLAELRSTGAYYFLVLIVRQGTGVTLRMDYFKTANATLVPLAPDPALVIAAGTKYRIKLKMYKAASGSDLGKIILSIDGAVSQIYDGIDDSGQGNIASVRIGVASSNLPTDVAADFGNVNVSEFVLADQSTRATEDVTISGTILHFVNGLYQGHT